MPNGVALPLVEVHHEIGMAPTAHPFSPGFPMACMASRLGSLPTFHETYQQGQHGLTAGTFEPDTAFLSNAHRMTPCRTGCGTSPFSVADPNRPGRRYAEALVSEWSLQPWAAAATSLTGDPSGRSGGSASVRADMRSRC